jgi:hypothetical protein
VFSFRVRLGLSFAPPFCILRSAIITLRLLQAPSLPVGREELLLGSDRRVGARGECLKVQ